MGVRSLQGRGEVWQSLTVGTDDPGCFGADGGERGRESEAEVETVNFYRKEDEGTADPFPPCVSPSGKTPKKLRIWKEHERKKSSLNALRSSLFPSLPPSRTSLNLILNPLQFPPRDSILSFPVSILFHSLAFILSVFFSSFLWLSTLLWNNACARREISINCLLFDCINEREAFFWTL